MEQSSTWNFLRIFAEWIKKKTNDYRGCKKKEGEIKKNATIRINIKKKIRRSVYEAQTIKKISICQIFEK